MAENAEAVDMLSLLRHPLPGAWARRLRRRGAAAELIAALERPRLRPAAADELGRMRAPDAVGLLLGVLGAPRS